jgi:hypothetical protein
MTFLHQHAEDRAKGKDRRKRPTPPPLNSPRVLPAGMTVRDLMAVCATVGVTRRAYYHRRKLGLTHTEALSVPAKHGVRLRDRIPGVNHNVINAALRAWK